MDQSVGTLQNALEEAELCHMLWHSSDYINMFTEAIEGFFGKLADGIIHKTIISFPIRSCGWINPSVAL